MPKPASEGMSPTTSTAAIESMHKLLLEALRHREQEIVRYLAILGPAVGGFVWLLHSGTGNKDYFTIGTIGVLLLLLLGAVYSLALGYNYRYIVLELAKLEAVLGIRAAMLKGWPRSRQDFLDRYKLCFGIPWCTPPEVIRVFWCAFLSGIVGVLVIVCTLKPETRVLVLLAGVVCLLAGLLFPIWFGFKLRKQASMEPESWAIEELGDAAAASSQPGQEGDDGTMEKHEMKDALRNVDPLMRGEIYRTLHSRFLSNNARIWATAAVFVPLAAAPFAVFANLECPRWQQAVLLAVVSATLLLFWIVAAERHREFQDAQKQWMEAFEELCGLPDKGTWEAPMSAAGTVRTLRFVFLSWVMILWTVIAWGARSGYLEW